MGLEPEMTRDSPLAAIITPNVATNGGTFILEIVTPLMRPASMPVAIPPRMPAGIGSPQLLISTPIITADSVITVPTERDRKSTRLNSSHDQISYAVFCLKKKKPVNHDEEDIEPDPVEAGLQDGETPAILCPDPTFQNPNTRTRSRDRRELIVEFRREPEE